jgi:signal transduction histidine kinase
MAITAADLLAVLDRARLAAESEGRADDRAAALAAAVRSAWPGTAIAACRLDGPGGTVVTAFDGAGRPKPDLAAALGEDLAGPAGDAAAAGITVTVAALEAGGRRHGGLAAAVPPEDAPALSAAAHAAAEALDRTALADELADRDWLADLGEVVGPVTHEFNNFLNTLMLQVAVMEMTAANGVKSELQGLKRQGKQIAGVVRQLQQYRRRRGGDPQPADLSRAALAAAEAIELAPCRPEGSPRVHRDAAAEPGIVPLRLDLADRLPLVSGPAADLRRLCRFLLSGAAWAVAGGGSLTLTTTRSDGGATLRLDVAGAAGGALRHLLDGPVATDGCHGLELAACQSLVRRLAGSMHAEEIPGGEAIVVDLPAAPAG